MLQPVFDVDPRALRDLLAREARFDGGAWTEIQNGDECRVFRVEAAGVSRIVRVHPERHRASRIRWTHALAVHCRLTVPEVVAPLALASGSSVAMLGGHPVSVFPWVPGDDLDAEDAGLRLQAASVLAALHRASAPFALAPPAGGPPTAIEDAPLPGFVQDPDFDAWERALPSLGLLRLPIHGDFYPRNVLATPERITGVIDWDEAQIDYRMAELSWTVWELCQNAEGDDFSRERAEAFVDRYRTDAPPCSGQELDLLVPFIRRRLRREILYQLAVIERGGPWNDEHQAYLDSEIRAFANLRSSTTPA